MAIDLGHPNSFAKRVEKRFVSSSSVTAIMASAVLQYVRRGKIKEIHDFGDNRGEIMEIEILPTSKFADKKINELELPKAVTIGAIVRKKEVIFPDYNDIILINDKIILYTDPNSIKDVEKLSEVNIEFF